MEIVTRDGENGRGRGKLQVKGGRKTAVREPRDGVARMGWGWEGSRETDRCTGERKIWFTFLISFYQALGESSTKQEARKKGEQ